MSLRFDRRAFLYSLGAGACLTPFLSPFSAPVAAQALHTKRRFVFLYIPGGWDQLLFLDPREAEFHMSEDEYAREVERTGIDTAYRGSTMDLYGTDVHRVAGADDDFYFGPAALTVDSSGEPTTPINLKTLAENGVPMSIVRGMNMGTLGHETAYLYFLTGQTPTGSVANGTSMPIRIAAQLAEQDPELAGSLLSTIALGVGSYTGNASGRLAALQARSIDDLEYILARDPSLVQADGVEQALAAYASRPLGPIAERYNAQGLLESMADTSELARVMLRNDLAKDFRFLTENDEASRAIRSRYNLHGDSSPRSARAVAAFVSQSIKLGLSQFISASIGGGGDSHGAGNRAHAQGLHRGLDAIARLIHDLSETPASADLGGSWLDHTTLCIFSEFGRTPLFNAFGGRDHHFTNSCLLVGAGIRPGVVAGASSDTLGQAPVTFDFDTQERLADDDSGEGPLQHDIRPQDIGATLLASAELYYGEYRGAHPLWKVLTTDPYE